MDHLFNILNYFSSVGASRGDDPLTEEWKAKRLRAWASLVFLAIGFGLSLLLANTMDRLSGNGIFSAIAEQWRPTAAYIVGGGLSILLLFSPYCWWSVVRFAQKHGAG
ncbi:hypothetical protein [Hydrogenophaga sp.]|uniref:hypothetical protein n=1 Tax=Hydrogenophaga sp. TaxID=1904254 RepID=UPI0027158836|nr:hypothetical protein [Hydrogenophaga sp.]MDO9437719.1 hypothetical protein [Hydrogenophaga sp.]